MKFFSTQLKLPSLETPRLRLRKLKMEDAPDVFIYASDSQVTRHLRFAEHHSLADSRAYLERLLLRPDNSADLAWGIEAKETRRIIGGCRLNCELENCRAELGYVLARKWWGQGLATEAVRAVLHFAFTQIRLNRIEARCFPEHTASIRVLEKCGFRFEAVLRQCEMIKGEFADLKVYSLLRDEFDPKR
jgi:ribosomal-protein-alanine N-acetyltransferase